MASGPSQPWVEVDLSAAHLLFALKWAVLGGFIITLLCAAWQSWKKENPNAGS